MLSSGRFLATIASSASHNGATPLALACAVGSRCISLPGNGIPCAASTSGARRLVQNQAGGNKADGAASAPAPTQSESSSSTSQPSPSSATAPLQAPSTSPEAQALADKLKQSSPTGRLLDLFAPQGGRQPRTASPSSSAAVAATPSTSEESAAADADVVRVVMRAVENCKPLMKVQQSKAGTKMVFVPKPLDPARSTNFAIKWILQAAQKRKDAFRKRGGSGAAAAGAGSSGSGAGGAKGSGSMAECLAAELLLAYQRKGGARLRRDEIHKLALDNRANLVGRWWS